MTNLYSIQDYQQIIAYIQSLDYNKLSTKHIEDIICSFGLNPDTRFPAYFDRYGIPNYYAQCFHSGELMLWQKPNELSRAIYHLISKYTIESFLEIGTYKAATFIVMREFLKLKNTNLISMSIDPYADINPEILNVFDINLKKITIDNVNNQFDLIFIDGNHAYNYVRNDYEKSLKLNPKLIMFHDIIGKPTPDVIRLWTEIKHIHKNYYEFTDNQPVMGIGIIEI